jgi:hypothetical protein
MSFGVFLLKQIHSFSGGEALSSSEQVVQGRNFVDTNMLEPSDIDILFEQPNSYKYDEQNTAAADNSGEIRNENKSFGKVQEQITNTNTSMKDREQNATSKNSTSSPEMNNMFRAALNLVNAYTKSDRGLECVWSLYCQDLDKTAAKKGSMYSLAARINR